MNDKDDSRCSIKCQHARKINGNYQCLLFEQEIDTGEASYTRARQALKELDEKL